MLPQLSIVVVNYRTKALLLELLQSIFAADNGSLAVEVIVIDNASGDDSEISVKQSYPQVKYYANSQNRYFSAAYTQGIQAACGEYVLVLNPDMVVRGKALLQLIEKMREDATIGAATTTTYFPEGSLQRNGSRFTSFGYLVWNYTLLGKLLSLLWPARMKQMQADVWYADWDRTSDREVDVLPGCAIIARREVWLACGAFDTRMLMYFSDDYFSRQVQSMGKRTVYLVSDGIVHYEGQSAKQVSAWALRVYLRDLLVYTRLVWGRIAQVTLGILLIPTWVVQRLKAR
ncbi:MAG: hypothetical protein OHK0023_03790 [Anaerolineae bacterium]